MGPPSVPQTYLGTPTQNNQHDPRYKPIYTTCFRGVYGTHDEGNGTESANATVDLMLHSQRKHALDMRLRGRSDNRRIGRNVEFRGTDTAEAGGKVSRFVRKGDSVS
jgi:hypothetical protein